MTDPVRNGGVDRVLCQIALCAAVVVFRRVVRERAALGLHLVRGLPCSHDHFAHSTHGLGIRRHHAQRAEIVQHVLGADGFRSNPRFRERQVLGDIRTQVVADHQHVQVLLNGVDGERASRIGRRRQRILETSHLDDVRRVATAGSLGMVGVDRSPADGANRVFDEPGLVDRVGMDRHLHVHFVGHAQTRVDRGRRAAPVLVQLEPDSARSNLLAQAFGASGVALAQKPQVDGVGVGGLQHSGQVPPSRCAGRRVRAGARSGAAAQHRGDPRRDGVFDLLRSDEVNVRVDPAGGEDQSFASNDVRAHADHEQRIDAVHDVRIAGFADRADQPNLYSDVGFDDPPVIENQGVGDHQVRYVRRSG